VTDTCRSEVKTGNLPTSACGNIVSAAASGN
jgi:hypothetical protein